MPNQPDRALAGAIREVARVFQRARIDYNQSRYVFQGVRKLLKLKRPRQSRRLVHVLTESNLEAFYKAISKGGNLQHEIMLKLLLYTALRVSELAAIEVADVDLDSCKIFIQSGKGDKDRYILYPESFRLILRAHLAANPENRFLFESRQRTKFSTRRIEYIVSEYAEAAGIEQRVHPHLLRHQMLTWLTAQGLTDAQIQLISGHASKKSLEVYQHLSLSQTSPAYQEAVKKLEV